MSASHCLPISPSDSCLSIPSLSTITPLTPLTDDCTLVTPLLVFGLSLLLTSLTLSHFIGPVKELGQLGPRGRRNYNWNESRYGAGGRFVDWWLFGGCVWIRAIVFVWDWCMSDNRTGCEEVGGENLFACFGVACESKDESKENGEKSDGSTKHHHVGIVGYDSSLGAHGPVVLAPIRASIFLLVWCSVCTFLVRTHDEMANWLINFDGEAVLFIPAELNEYLMTTAVYFLSATRYILNVSPQFSNDTINSPVMCTIIYAATFIIILELALLILGILLNFTGIYIPKGVSHPGGPRPHKIMRVPKWTESQSHIMPKELLVGKKNEKWRCAVAHDAHRDTLAKFKIAETRDGSNEVKATLTGEPFGRQMWTMMESQPRQNSTETEDDLNTTLRKEFKCNIATRGDVSNQQKNDSKEEMPNLFQQIGDFFTNTPPRKSQSKPKEMNQNDLVQHLASGGRPPMAFDPSKNVNSCDQIFRAQMISSYLNENGGKLPGEMAYLQTNIESSRDDSRPQTVMEAAKRGVAFYSMLQTSDGHWAGDYGGPHFLMPGLIVAWYVMGKPELMISPAQQALMLHYLRVHQQEDGGWGTHIESPSTMFGAVICYLAVRLLGAEKDEKWIVKGREFIMKEGGAVMTSSWAKFWLCLIGCMDWKGHNSVPPEMWLLPNWFPFHPGRLWCHCRMVYLPMGYLYGSRFTYADAETDPLIQDLREELYVESYDSIDWDSTRHLVAPMDNYSPIPLFMKFAQNCLSVYENWSIFRPFRDAVRKAGLKFCLEYMRAEDLQTNYIDIGPVNKALNLVAAYHASNFDINDQAVQNHIMRVPDYLWVAEDGMKMQGYNGSQCWDTSFAIQAVWECGLLDAFPLMSSKVWAYLERTQILSTDISQSSPAYQYESCENRDKFYRHVSKGGWPFSTSAHGWPISDCTGEGLKGVLALMDSPLVMQAVKSGLLKGINADRLYDAVNVILTLQNEDGGWATYENNRGFGWYEQLNPSEVFGDIMIDYSYVECSMASLTALADFHEKFPNHRTKEIAFALRRGGEFMKSIQREDGSWYGSWACCFTYGCWFGIEGLIKAGEQPSSTSIQKCCRFLLSHQRPNGGWGEDFTSCYDKAYAANGMQSYGDDGSGVVNTAWALMALSAAKCDNIKAIRRGVQYLMNRQLDCGDWPQEGISGVFNRACGITYTAYRNVFPIWALGRCAATYGDVLDEKDGCC